MVAAPSEPTMKSPIVVAVTGAAGQIAYSLLFSLAKGDVFGPDQGIELRLLDIPVMQQRLYGVMMEIQDCAYPLVKSLRQTDNADECFNNADIALLIGSMPRREGQQRSDLLQSNGNIFRVQGASLDRVAKKNVKVLVVGNPANTNALICSRSAPSLDNRQFTCMTHLDQNRAKACLAKKIGVSPTQIENVIIWGNHSTTQYPDISHAIVRYPDDTTKTVKEAVNNLAFLQGKFIEHVQTRGQQVIHARKLSSAMSAAKAIGDHLRTWWFGTTEGEFCSMGVLSDGSYGIEAGIFYSMPVTIKDGQVSIVKGLNIDDFSRERMDKSKDELLTESQIALEMIAK
eukprot:m.139760 g.139760  ORF g.139760 m.139760 type:complete len:343 (+) comp30077_c0_seq1:466-1494(+)